MSAIVSGARSSPGAAAAMGKTKTPVGAMSHDFSLLRPSVTAEVPDLEHLTMRDYDSVYEPAEDSFLLLDAIESVAPMLAKTSPAIVVEIGSVPAPHDARCWS